MRHLGRIAGVTVGALVLGGCAVTRENQTACKVSATILGAAIGGASIGAGVGYGTKNDGAGAGAAVGGAALGGTVGWLIGDHMCQVPPEPPPPPPPAPKRIETLNGPGFEFNKATLTPEGRTHVDHAVQVMRDNPTMHVSVEGHTDSIGSDAYNMKLSQRRADSVRDYMIDHGIAASRITTAAYGETRPIASNDTESGRAENRRVEIIAR
jgi:OOP family OmpA-OmpF porin